MKTFFKCFSISAYITTVIISFSPLQGLASKTKTTYNPPKGRVREQVRKAGGSRGCHLPLEDIVTLLVPEDHTAITISSNPTFFWHLSQKSSLPLRFTLVEPGGKTLFTKELKPEAGIVAMQLPQNSKPLEIGKTYRWTVTVICNKNKPSRNLFAQAWIERVSFTKFNNYSEDISNKLSCNTKYAQIGVWYDALYCAYIEQSAESQDISNKKREFWSLLEEIDLNFIARKQSSLK